MNLHTPERGADETQAQYRARRAASHAAVKRQVNPSIWQARRVTPASRMRRQKRAIVKMMGIRQYKKQQDALRNLAVVA